ncbi:hypothetical protein CEXT_653981 [Caerostris extrusa]|uniref:Uncharacterized protein n=1 Tax=Caerostris extrusa TaxID=172846 RepID=A0AAV4SY01_CAEEX|nr:hypothetical protein CEXT_653981 [Caerostris extrusa]
MHVTITLSSIERNREWGIRDEENPGNSVKSCKHRTQRNDSTSKQNLTRDGGNPSNSVKSCKDRAHMKASTWEQNLTRQRR